MIAVAINSTCAEEHFAGNFFTGKFGAGQFQKLFFPVVQFNLIK